VAQPPAIFDALPRRLLVAIKQTLSARRPARVLLRDREQESSRSEKKTLALDRGCS
jgi:hypothetical protein